MLTVDNAANILSSGVSVTRTYILEGLDCANCAAKIKTMDGVDDVSITFATKQLKLSAKNPDALSPQIQSVINAMEDGVTVVPKDAPQGGAPEAKKEMSEQRMSILSIAIGAVLFVVGEVMEHMGTPLPALLGALIVAYLILGGKVLLTAAKNIKEGQAFDEDFLMPIATLGTFAIAEYPETVGVILCSTAAVRIARSTSRISWQNVYFAMAVKLIVMLMGLFGLANMWIGVFADTGVSMLCLLNSVRIFRMK